MSQDRLPTGPRIPHTPTIPDTLDILEAQKTLPLDGGPAPFEIDPWYEARLEQIDKKKAAVIALRDLAGIE